MRGAKALVGAAVVCWSAASATPPAADCVEVINANTPVRAFIGWRTAVYITADGQVKVPVAGKEANCGNCLAS